MVAVLSMPSQATFRAYVLPSWKRSSSRECCRGEFLGVVMAFSICVSRQPRSFELRHLRCGGVQSLPRISSPRSLKVTIEQMQRLLAILLLCNFSFLLSAPAVSAGQQATVPACCRRDGKHQCAMRQSGENTLRSVGEKCPCCPLAVIPAPHVQTVLPRSVNQAAELSLAQRAGRQQPQSRVRIPFSRSSQERGPPSLLS